MNTAPLRSVAPRPTNTPNPNPSHLKTFNCQSCVQKKIKCNRLAPTCTGCRRRNLACVYQEPPKSQRRKQRKETVQHRAERFENILRKHNLLDSDDLPEPQRPQTDTPLTRLSKVEQVAHANRVRVPDIQASEICQFFPTGPFLSTQVLLDAAAINEQTEVEDDVLQRESAVDSSERTSNATSTLFWSRPDPISEWHATPQEIWKLWKIYKSNVDPLCKLVHIPTTEVTLSSTITQPAGISKPHDCLVLAICYISLCSTTEIECQRLFGRPRHDLLAQYDGAVKQALVNADWLRSRDLATTQAMVLFLAASRFTMDLDTFWVLIGVGVRVAQRLRLNRDGHDLGLPPFEVEMRRRLFWQLVSLDAFAGQFSGTGVSMMPETWTTKPPLNINDDQIFPGMKEQPVEQTGATEMLFCLTKVDISPAFRGAASSERDVDIEKLLDEVEQRIEARRLRYCDVANPMNFYVMTNARTSINIVRLRHRMKPLLSRTISDDGHRGLFDLASKIINSDILSHSNAVLACFRWHAKSLFLWHSLVCMLTAMAKPSLLSVDERTTAWDKISTVYANHPDYLERHSPLRDALCRLTLIAWRNTAQNDPTPVPKFINAISSQAGEMRQMGTAKEVCPRVEDQISNTFTDGMFGNLQTGDLGFEDDYSLGLFNLTAMWN